VDKRRSVPGRPHLPPQSLPVLNLRIHLVLASAWGTLQALSITPLNQAGKNLDRHIKFQLYEFTVLVTEQDGARIKGHNGILVPVVRYRSEIHTRKYTPLRSSI